MTRHVYLVLLMIMAIGLFGCPSDGEPKVTIKTNHGNVIIKLYNETPQHRDNFLKLVKEDFYDSLLFHRVIKDFMIQAGDPKSRNSKPGARLGSGGPGYKVPAEIVPMYFHKKGALSAARQSNRVNPEKQSSGSQFYIVQGKPLTDQELDMMENQIDTKRNSVGIKAYLADPSHQAMRDTVTYYQQQRNGKALDSIANVILDSLRIQEKLQPEFKYTSEQRNVYKMIGGTPFLDTEYTVFGEVIKGLDIIDQIANVPTQAGDRPIEDVIILEMKVTK